MLRPFYATLVLMLVCDYSHGQAVSGYVRDPDGQVIENAKVTITTNKGQLLGTAYTGGNGYYSLPVPGATTRQGYFVSVAANMGSDGKDRRRAVANNLSIGSAELLMINFIPERITTVSESEDDKVRSRLRPDSQGKGECSHISRRCSPFRLFRCR